MAAIEISRTNRTGTQANVHLLPCEIDANGPAAVTTFFSVEEVEGQNTAFFRGRELKGHKISLEPSLTGRVLTESKHAHARHMEASDDEDGENAGIPARQLREVQQFRKVITWTHDRVPTAEDPIQTSLAWHKISQALHGDSDNEA